MSTSRDYTTGQVLTAAQADDWGQGALGFAQQTSDSSSTSGTTILDILTAPAVTLAAANRLIRITASWRALVASTDPGVWIVLIREGSTSLQQQAKNISALSVGMEGSTLCCMVASPTAASHTYKISLQRVTGTGTALMQGNASYPIQILVEDCGTAP